MPIWYLVHPLLRLLHKLDQLLREKFRVRWEAGADVVVLLVLDNKPVRDTALAELQQEDLFPRVAWLTAGD